MKITLSFTVALALTHFVTAEAAGPAPCLPVASVPGDGRITLVDYTHCDWGPELVRYRPDTSRFTPGRLELLVEDGRRVPFQITKIDGKSILSFVAAVAGGKSVTYTLKACNADASRDNSEVFHRVEGGSATIGNEHFALRLPRAQRQRFAPPLSAERVPPPIFAWRPTGSNWAGGSHLVTERPVAEFEVRVLEEGPATVSYECRYRFEPAGQTSGGSV